MSRHGSFTYSGISSAIEVYSSKISSNSSPRDSKLSGRAVGYKFIQENTAFWISTQSPDLQRLIHNYSRMPMIDYQYFH
jgi:hypothetical protein